MHYVVMVMGVPVQSLHFSNVGTRQPSFLHNKKYVLWNVYLPNVVHCIPYTVIEIFEYNCNDLELGRFKVIQGQGHGANR